MAKQKKGIVIIGRQRIDPMTGEEYTPKQWKTLQTKIAVE